jgi:uncharacterized protein YaeQ
MKLNVTISDGTIFIVDGEATLSGEVVRLSLRSA